MEDRHLVKGPKIGKGAYGFVYETTMENENGEPEKYALKRNLTYVDVKGIDVVRELHFLATLNHPMIVKLVEVTLRGNPFDSPMTPTKHAKDGNCHFLLEKADMDLRKYLRGSRKKNMRGLKNLMCQICIGMEYIHSKGIIHRDIKPDNILLKKVNKTYSAIITDFGLSSLTTKYRPSTPGVVSSWFRAPEIASRYEYYDTKIDVWSIGCLLFEMACYKEFIYADDKDRSVIKNIANTHPNLSRTDWDKFLSKAGRKYDLNYRTSDKGFKNLIFEKNTDLAIQRMDFDEESGKLDEFVDLLDKMLKINPDERYSMTEALNHPFFSFWNKDIECMREKYIHTEEDKIYIHNCIERAWACNIALDIYNSREGCKWYCPQILFKALRIFDDHLHKVYTSSKTKFRDRVTRDMGKIYTRTETILYFYTCIYLVIKFLVCLEEPPRWKNVFPKKFNKENYIEQSEIFEEEILQSFEYSFIRPTFLDILEKESCSEEDKKYNVRKALLNYCHIKEDYSGNLNNLFKQQYKSSN
jgi:serine/threonine protein kinase